MSRSDRARLIRAWPGLTPTPPNPSSSVAYSPDGGGIAVSLITQSPTDPVPTAARLMMLDASTGRTRWQRRYPMHPTSKSGPGVPGQLAPEVEFTRGGLMLTSAQQGETILWSARSGRILRRFPVGGFAGDVRRRRARSPWASTATASRPRAPRSRSSICVPAGKDAFAPIFRANGSARSRSPPTASESSPAPSDTVHVWDVASGQIAETDNPQTGRRLETTVDPRGATVLAGVSGRKRRGVRLVRNPASGPLLQLEHTRAGLRRPAVPGHQPAGHNGDGPGRRHDCARRPPHATADADAPRA